MRNPGATGDADIVLRTAAATEMKPEVIRAIVIEAHRHGRHVAVGGVVKRTRIATAARRRRDATGPAGETPAFRIVVRKWSAGVLAG